MKASSVSVVIPVYNGARYLAEAIESALGQTVRPAEVIVIDDGSEDETPQVAARFERSIRYIRQTNAGLASARNAGVELASSEHLAFLDSDDIWLPQKLDLQLAALGECKRAAMIYAQIVQFASPDLSPDEVAALKFDPAPLPGISASMLLIRMRDFQKAGLFDRRLRVGEFIEWYSRAQDADISTMVLPEILCRRRLHRNNLGRRRAELGVDYARALKRVLDRRRQVK
jgi:glycosyltransferase involved in cell wall biosynthesis